MKTETVEEFLARGGKVETLPERERRDFSRHGARNRRWEAERVARELAKREPTP